MDRSRRYASSVDVARLAGVSQSAVSRTFTPGGSVSPRTRAKVLDAARQLGFRPSAVPQTMLTGRSGIVAMVVPAPDGAADLAGPLLPALVAGLRGAGRQVLLVPASPADGPDDVAAELARYRVDAVLNLCPTLVWSGSHTLPAFRLPIVSLVRPECDAGVWSVCPDHHGAGMAAAALLHRRGARACAMLGDPDHDPAHAMRFAGFRDGLHRLGLDEPVSVACEPSHAGGQAAAATLLAHHGQTDAVFCATDPIAFGVLDALRRHDRPVPGATMVVGFGDHAAAAWDAYGLTTFGPDPAAVLQHVLALLAIAATQPNAPGSVVSVETRLIERRSTGGQP